MKKRLLATILALVMCAALLPTAAFAELLDFTIEGSVLTKYNGPGGHVIVPDGITRIETNAFQGCTGLTSVSIPQTVTTIGTYAFYGCEDLKDIYFSGTEAQWKVIRPEYEYSGDDLTKMGVTVHFNSTGSSGQPTTPEQPTTPDKPTTPDQPAENVAYSSTQNVLVDGKAVEFQAYALKDANGNDTNYVKLRDVAYALNDTAAQFSVGWDAAAKSISVTSGEAYEANGSEMKTPYSGNRAYTVSSSPLYINGKAADLGAILLTDDAGNGYTYFKLRDLGDALGFSVGWSADKGIYIETK